MKISRLYLALALLLSFFAAPQVKGTIYTYSPTINLSASFNDTYDVLYILYGYQMQAVTLQQGDTLGGTVSFAPNQQFGFIDSTGTSQNTFFVKFRFNYLFNNSFSLNANFTFNGLHGDVSNIISTVDIDTVTTFFYPTAQIDATGSVSFSSFTYSLTLVSTGSQGMVTDRVTAGPLNSIDSVAIVPEPSPIAFIPSVLAAILILAKPRICSPGT